VCPLEMSREPFSRNCCRISAGIPTKEGAAPRGRGWLRAESERAEGPWQWTDGRWKRTVKRRRAEVPAREVPIAPRGADRRED
jgi:hypothetical protein